MATTKFTMDPKNLPKLTTEEKARLDAMTDEQITAAADADPDNLPLNEDELQVISAQRIARRAREKQGMTQEQFAATYNINHGRLRDIERGRGTRGDSALVAYLRVIEAAPEVVQRILTVRH